MNRTRHLYTLSLVSLFVLGCSAPPPPTYSTTTSGNVATVTVNVKFGRFEQVTAKFDLEGKKDGERLTHEKVYADPDAQDSRGNAEGGRLKIVYVVGQGVETITWDDKPVPATSD